jgi:hypothetical protein
VAVALFAFIVLYQRRVQKTAEGPIKVLPNLKPAAATSVQVRPGAQLEIRAERTNGTWQLKEPFVYPAQALSIEKLLAELERLTPAPYITARELRDRPKSDEEYGFAAPQASIIVEQPGYTYRLRVGAKTAPGDQVFLQVVGAEGVYVVDAEFLKHLPRTADDWRDTALINLNVLAFDRLTVTNGAKIFELRRDTANKLWRMVYPLQARANNAKADESLQMLQSVRVHQFVSDDPKADLETFGLRPPELEVALGQGTNTVARLQFGKSPTNDTRLVYARRLGLNAIVAVPKDLLAPWYAQVNEFRDPFLVTWTSPVAVIEVRGQDSFSLQHQTNDTWRVLPPDFPVDAGLVKDLLFALSGLQIVEFTKDVVIAPDLPLYGLASPARQYILKSAATDSPAGSTNAMIAEVDFGTNQADKVFARRADESFVYAVKLADFQRLPAASWEMRERQIWKLSTNDVARVTIRQQGRIRQIVRNGPHEWALSPPQGIINDLAVEETVSRLCQLAAVAWVARGDQNRARYGLVEKGHQITLELKSGDKLLLEFGNETPPTLPYAAVTLDGGLWIFEFPAWLYGYVEKYLFVPPNP